MKVNAEYVHTVSGKHDKEGPFYMEDYDLWAGDARNNTVARLLRDSGVLGSGARVREMRVEGDRLLVFPTMPGLTTYHHCVIITRA